MCLVKALNICLADYDQRFLHKTYLILQKLRNHLIKTFQFEDLKHKCGSDCNGYIQFPKVINQIQLKHSQNLDGSKEMNLETREKVIGSIVDEEKSYLMAKKFKLDNSNNICNSNNGREQNKHKSSDKTNESGTFAIKDKADKEYCVRQFLQYVTFDIDFELRLQDYDKYYRGLNNLDSVLDDILSSVSDKNLIDGIDCY